LAVRGFEALILFDAVHRECARAMQPFLVAGPPIDFQKQQTIAAGTVT
jgi:hypothetical protein